MFTTTEYYKAISKNEAVLVLIWDILQYTILLKKKKQAHKQWIEYAPIGGVFQKTHILVLTYTHNFTRKIH